MLLQENNIQLKEIVKYQSVMTEKLKTDNKVLIDQLVTLQQENNSKSMKELSEKISALANEVRVLQTFNQTPAVDTGACAIQDKTLLIGGHILKDVGNLRTSNGNPVTLQFIYSHRIAI